MYHFGLVLDPLSENAQKWSSLLDVSTVEVLNGQVFSTDVPHSQWLSSIPGVFIEVRLNPAALSEVPLKRFYRYNLLSKIAFDEDG